MVLAGFQSTMYFCFCTSAGLDLNSAKGSDILLTKLKSGDYLADILTEKGKAVYDFASELFENITDGNQSLAVETIVAEVPVKFDSKTIRRT